MKSFKLKSRSTSALALSFALIAVSCSSHSTKSGSGGSGSSFVIPPPTAITEGDIERGKTIASNGSKGGAAACLACHGVNGEGQSASAFPRLAKQSPLYLVSQLQAYADGSRENAIMQPIAKALNDQDQHDVAAYYSSLTATPFEKANSITGAKLKRALQLTEHGDAKLGLQSCQNCHGPGGIGEGPAIPYLKGQFAVYTSGTLQAWKSGKRKTNPEHMGYIAKLLNDADIQTLAAYYQQVPNGDTKGNKK